MSSELSTPSPRSFWKKPEGKTGMVALAGAGVGAYFLVPIVAPVVLLAFQTTVTLVALCAVLGLCAVGMMDGRFRALVSYGFKGVVRGFTNIFVPVYPIPILEGYIDDIRQNREEINTQLSKLKGQLASLQAAIVKKKEEKETNMLRADKAQRSGKNDLVLIAAANKTARLDKTTTTLTNLYNKLEGLYRTLFRIYEISEVVLEDTIDEVKTRKEEYEFVKGADSAMRAGMKILKGDTPQKLLFDQAMESLADQISAKKGEMDNFIEISAKLISSVELDNSLLQEKGLKELERWQNEKVSFLLGSEKQILLAKAEDSREVLDLTKQPSVRKNRYQDMLMEGKE